MATSIIKQEFNTVDLGGTGATNAADARENLEVYSKSETTALIEEAKTPSLKLQIPTGQWSGSGPYTYSVNVSKVTANTEINPVIDSSVNYLTADLTITTGNGTLTCSTTKLPTGTVNITVFFPGVQGEVIVETLADVYSKSQVDALIQQSTANSPFTFIGKYYLTANGGTKSIEATGISGYLVIIGGWNYKQIFIVYPANGNTPRKCEIAYYSANSPNYPVSAYGSWGFTVTNDTPYAVNAVIYSISAT